MKKQSAETKNKILHATLELISKQGFHGTSVSQIAEKSNVNVGSMYYHFENKDAILIALYLDCKARITQYAFHDCSEDMAADKCLKLVLENVVRYSVENRAEFLFMEQFESSPYLNNNNFTEKYAEITKPYFIVFERLKGQGVIKDLPIEICQSLLLGAVTSLTKYYLNNENAFNQSALSDMVNAILDMVKKQ
jgi:AcrR family transcriptional regulator